MKGAVVTKAVIGAALLCALAPEVFEFRRDGEVWSLLTGQLVHWTPRMAVLDLGVLAACGAWIERRSARAWCTTLLAAAALTALAVRVSGVDVYRGSSGLATAAFVAVALSHPRRALGVAALVLLAAKVAWETRHAGGIAAGALPAGVAVLPGVHVAGVLAGLASGRLRLEHERERRARPAAAQSGPGVQHFGR
jgi:membrane associated rhomboid family serine protease